MQYQTRRRLMIGLAVTGLALMLGAIPVNAQTTEVFGPSSSGSISMLNNGTGSLEVVFPTVLSGTGYAFDSGGTASFFSIDLTSGLSTFTSSDQGTTLSLNGGAPTPVTWVDMGGGELPGIIVLQFTTPLASSGPYDYLILNINSLSQPYLAPASFTPFETSPAVPAPANYNACDEPGGCSYDSVVEGGGTIITSYYICDPFDIIDPWCVSGTSPNPITTTADISSGEVLLGTPLPTPEPSSFLLMEIGLLALFLITKFKTLTA
jgi:hypothetical protein